jgi:hypothetical protein
MRPLPLHDLDMKLARQAADFFIEWSKKTQETDNPHTRAVPWKNDYERKYEMQMAYGAEIGVARLLGLDWNGLNTFKDKADVGDNVEVRWSRSNNLILRHYDRDGDVAFLVQGSSLSTLFLVGYYPVYLGRIDDYKLEDEETWFIPKDRLYDYMPYKEAVRPFLASLGARPT